MASIKGRRGAEDDLQLGATDNNSAIQPSSFQPVTPSHNTVPASGDAAFGSEQAAFEAGLPTSFPASLFMVHDTPVSVDLSTGLSEEDAVNIEAILLDLADSSSLFSDSLAANSDGGLFVTGPYGAAPESDVVTLKLSNKALSDPDAMAGDLARQIGGTLPHYAGETTDVFLAEVGQQSAYRFDA